VKKKFFDFRFLRQDLIGGLTAGIVALPLALAFGEQSGLGASAGLYGAAFIAFFASLFGGTPTQISGPTAPMTALSMIVVGGLLQAFEGKMEEALPVILTVFLLAGLFQIVLGVLKLGAYIRFIPYTVVSGFMTGIGVIILITQFPIALGYYSGEDLQVIEQFKPKAEASILDRILQKEAEDGVLVLNELRRTMIAADKISTQDVIREAEILAENDGRGVIGSLRYSVKAIENINYLEFALALSTVLLIFGIKKINSRIPNTLLALLIVSVVAYYFSDSYRTIQEIPIGIPEFKSEVFTSFSFAAVYPFLISAVLLSFLGSLDSLLTSVVADNLTKTRHNSNQELIGQGVGNSIAALFGGLPGAGATIRTVVNIQAGGKTKISGMVSGIILLIIILLLAPIASQIPAAVLAGILITVGIGVMDYKGLKALPKMQWPEKIILITVLLLTVFWQLVYAVGIGLVLASIVFLKKMSDTSADRVVITDLELDETKKNNLIKHDKSISQQVKNDHVVIERLNGPLFFGFTNQFRGMISTLPDMMIFVIRMDRVPFIDQSGVFALEAVILELGEKGVTTVITEANESVVKLLEKMKVTPHLVSSEHIFDDYNEFQIWLKGKEEEEEERN
jgi:SulP family sulfate permease